MNYTTQPQNKTPQWFVITWLIILLFFFVWKAVSQDRKDLPILNQRILHYVDSVEGTKIKNGVCRHFIMQAINYALPVRIKWGRKSNPENFLSWEGYNLPKEYALPGDIIYTSSHIGVIYEIDDSECIITAHQNNGEQKRKERKVVIEQFCPTKADRPKYLRVRCIY